MATVRFIAIGYGLEGCAVHGAGCDPPPVAQHSSSVHFPSARHFSPQLKGGMTFFRPVAARPPPRNSSIGFDGDRIMNAREWVFNVLGLLVLLALGVVG